MIKSILILGMFVGVGFLLIPDNDMFNNLGIIIIAIYFLVEIIYLIVILLLWLIFKIKKTPIEMVDEYIYQKFFILFKNKQR